ncbi:VirB6/TrbL-like conjugal transfer protein, CD1112 family [Defluviitalea phaphyphila]|uniref:VirB6/TrbL-like conjugal transfer protein, CD1112 family n=1 Tax=Defluviitalea phaphyphila TaxID=1473580 RepID=UPI0007309203|nr:CD0415/CD1112 family protein [Defluviitalea phaphyphila]
MEDFIVNRIEDIFNTVLTSNHGKLILTPEDFNSSIYSGVKTIMQDAAMPVAYVLLGLLFVLELYNITIRTEGQHGTMGVEIPFKVMFKLVICKTVVDSTELILNAMSGISEQIINNIKDTMNGGNPVTAADLEAIRAIVDDMKFSVKLMTSIEITIIFLIVKFISVIVIAMVVGRMIELYVMMAISPIPIATFPNTEMSSIAKNFLKSFAAVCLQGVLIYVVVTIFPLIFGNAVMGDISDPNDFSNSLLSATGYSFVLLMAIFSTGKWAKSICNAM